VSIFPSTTSNLAIKDSDTKSSDPYAKIKVAGNFFKTRIIKKNLNPVWDETFETMIEPLEGLMDVKLSLWDWDKFSSDDFLGCAVIKLDDYLHKGTRTIELPLASRAKKNDRVSGSVFVTVTFGTENHNNNNANTNAPIVPWVNPYIVNGYDPLKDDDFLLKCNPDAFGKNNLPPGYPNAPSLVAFAKGGSEDEYKAHMVSKYECERWENKLLLYIKKIKDRIAERKKELGMN